MGKQVRGKMFGIAGIIVIVGFFLPFIHFHKPFCEGVPDCQFVDQYNSLFNFVQNFGSHININSSVAIGTLAVGAAGILFLLLGYIMIYTNLTTTISTIALKILGFILSIGVAGFLYSSFLNFHFTPDFSNPVTSVPSWGFYLIVVGVMIGAITLIIPDKEDKGNTTAKDNTDAEGKTMTK